uniref:Uncharacterized protein n=1 Tax=Anguilla anguilla TaxID=7936 RepID=A0A0E9Q3B8_ANGAN
MLFSVKYLARVAVLSLGSEPTTCFTSPVP